MIDAGILTAPEILMKWLCWWGTLIEWHTIRWILLICEHTLVWSMYDVIVSKYLTIGSCLILVHVVNVVWFWSDFIGDLVHVIATILSLASISVFPHVAASVKNSCPEALPRGLSSFQHIFIAATVHRCFHSSLKENNSLTSTQFFILHEKRKDF